MIGFKAKQLDLKEIDSLETLNKHRSLISKKHYLKSLYKDFYQEILSRLSLSAKDKVVEIGSGGGFIKEIIPFAITSDVRGAPGIDMVFNASQIPFRDESIDALLMLNVFHHLQNVEICLQSFDRVLRPGGKIIMVEPTNTPWRRWTDRRFHNEIFDPLSSWDIGTGGPMSTANGALAWIALIRDQKILEEKFPNLKVTFIREHTPFRYFASGGLSYPQLLPNFTYDGLKILENSLDPFMKWIAIFQTIEITKTTKKKYE